MFTMVLDHNKTGSKNLSQSAQYSLVITALGKDRPGIVNNITRQVSSCGCNIEDSRLALLGEEFTLIMLLSGSWNAIALIESTLPLKGAELDLLIVMKRTEAQARPSQPSTVWFKVQLADSPHIIERFTELLSRNQMNIAELVSKTQPDAPSGTPQLYIEITAHASAPHTAAKVEQDFHLLCTELNAQGSISIVNNPQHQDEMQGEL